MRRSLDEVHLLLKQLIARNLSDKSLTRVDDIFKFFQDQKFLTTIFQKKNLYQDEMSCIIHDLNASLDSASS